MIAAALASSPPPLPGFLNALSGTLQHYGLWAIGLLILLEDFGVPAPGETILIAGAIYAGAGRLNIVAVGVVGFIAAVIGDNIGFAIGHFGGRALALRFGKYVFLTERRPAVLCLHRENLPDVLAQACSMLGAPAAVPADPSLPKGGFWVAHASMGGTGGASRAELASLERYEP